MQNYLKRKGYLTNCCGRRVHEPKGYYGRSHCNGCNTRINGGLKNPVREFVKFLFNSLYLIIIFVLALLYFWAKDDVQHWQAEAKGWEMAYSASEAQLLYVNSEHAQLRKVHEIMKASYSKCVVE